jgi:hypothetical protein
MGDNEIISFVLAAAGVVLNLEFDFQPITAQPLSTIMT